MNAVEAARRRVVPVWIGLLLPLLFLAGATQAAVAVGAKVGTLGVGAELSVDLSNRFVFRGGVATYQRDLDFTVSNIHYTGELELLDATALVDWYPAGNGFRLTGGLAWNDHRLVGRAPFEALLTQTAPIPPGIAVPNLGTLRGEATVDSLGPYFGIGFGRATAGSSSRWSLAVDFGVIGHGEPEVDLVIESPLVVPLAGLFPELVAVVDLLVELEERELEREVEDFRYFPVVSITVSYRF